MKLTNEQKIKLEQLKMYFLTYLVEDPQDGTLFDCLVIDNINEIGASDKEFLESKIEIQNIKIGVL